MAARIACTKHRYPSPQAAWATLEQRDRRHRRSRITKRSRYGHDRVYRCTECGAWHVTAGQWGTAADLQ